MNERNCPGCDRLERLEDDYAAFKRQTEDRLAKHDTQYAVINTKLSAILWGVGVIGTALVGVLVKLIFQI